MSKLPRDPSLIKNGGMRKRGRNWLTQARDQLAQTIKERLTLVRLRALLAQVKKTTPVPVSIKFLGERCGEQVDNKTNKCSAGHPQ